MNRTKKFFLNSLSTAIYQIVVMIVGFITPRILLSVYGSEINGLVSSITQFITYFSLVEAGIAGAAVYSLYKPLAEENHKEISVIVSSAKKFYLKAGLVFTALVIILAILYPIFVSVSDMSTLAVGILVFALGAKGFFEFFTLAKYRVLLTADQKTYIISNASTIYIIVQTIIIVILANLHVNVVIVYSLSIIALFIRSIILMIYTRHHYKYLKYNEPVNEKVLDKRWDALFLQIVQTVQTGAPVVLATIFTNLKSVSIYTIYNMVLNGINGVLSIFVNGLYASFGDLIARKETEKLKNVYREYEFSYYFIIAFVYSVAMVMLMPFIQLYTRGINDANYMQPLIGFLFVLNGILYSIKNPQGMLVMSAGLYKETRVQCSIQALIIIVGGIILAPTFGIAGILVANCLSNLYRTIDMGIFIPKNVTKLKPADSFKRMILVAFMIILGVLPFIFIDMPINSYFDWIIMAIIVSAYVLLVIPLDEESPELRLLRPQSLMIERLLQNYAIPVLYRPNLKNFDKDDFIKNIQDLKNTDRELSLIITDSQAINVIYDCIPQNINFTSFSIIMSNFMSNGKLINFINGARELDNIKDNDNILIVEACNHDRKCNDIATVQLPNAIKKYTQKNVNFDFNFGQTFLAEEEIKNKNYKLVIICGGCMIDKQKYQARLEMLEELKIPTSNYGIIFSYIKNKKILEDTAKIFN